MFVQSFEQTVREALETQMFLVQETGPTSFVIKQDGSDAKFKVSREFSAGHLLAVGTQSVSGSYWACHELLLSQGEGRRMQTSRTFPFLACHLQVIPWLVRRSSS